MRLIRSVTNDPFESSNRRFQADSVPLMHPCAQVALEPLEKVGHGTIEIGVRVSSSGKPSRGERRA